MNSIFKNKKKILVCLSFISMISLGFFMQGCSKENDMLDDNINTKYLDLNVESYVAFTPAELNILVNAIQRASEYLVFDGENYVFELESASKINISDRLFNYIYPSMQNVQPKTTGVPRLKSDSELKTYLWGTVYTTNLSHAEALDFLRTMRNVSAGGITTGIAAAAGKYSNIIGLFVTATSFLESTNWNKMYDSYVDSGSRNGVSLTQTNVSSGGYGVVSTYQIAGR